VAAGVKPHSLIIRTLDLGGDKLHEQLHSATEENPFLGWRAIRVCLERTDIFKTQLRAILRASTSGSIK
jgi:phosphoenolpyruvate-protein kinase (PTS system EI component)